MGSFLVDLNDGWREWAFPLLYFHTRFPFPVLLNESMTDSESECTPEGFFTWLCCIFFDQHILLLLE